MNLDPFTPDDESIFIAPNATVFGNVRMGAESSIWYGAVVRGDVEHIHIGSQTNIQDLCVLHADPGYPCVIGDRVTIGHAAIIHGATLEEDVLIGMRAVVLNGAVVGSGSVIAAGCVVTEGTLIPPRSLVMGMPGKVRGETNEIHAGMIARGAKHYSDAAKYYASRL